MAGIGFQLKKLFSRRGMLASFRAYGYATMVCAGPMILGFLLLLAVMIISDLAGSPRNERELLVSMITHALLASLVVTSVFSMLTTRFCADSIYEKKYNSLIPSLYGSTAIMLLIGGIGYGIFLYFSGVRAEYKLLSFILFMILILVWTEINYLTMLKDYKIIMLAFLFSLLTALILSIVFIWLFHFHVIISIMVALCIGYGMMACWYFGIIYRYLPEGFGTSLRFIEWFDHNPQLIFTGFFITLGLFGHLVIMWWASPLSVQVEGLFYGAPTHDVPAIYAFFSILITTINFIVTTETRFYPKYKEYFVLFNGNGSIEDLDEAEISMGRVLSEELGYLVLKQVFCTLLFIIFGSILLPLLPLGFNSEMLRIFRTLCVAYAFYAIGNSFLLVMQYFSDLTGAAISSVLFAVVSNVATLIFSLFVKKYYGFGFMIGSFVFCLFCVLRLCTYLKRLKYHVLVSQPILTVKKKKLFTKVADSFEGHASRVQHRRHKVYYEKLLESDVTESSANAEILKIITDSGSEYEV